MVGRIVAIALVVACSDAPPRAELLSNTAVAGPRAPQSGDRRALEPTASDPGTGAIEGIVVDGATNKPGEGATVIATSPALASSRLALSDRGGHYSLVDLPPATYTIAVHYNGLTSTQSDVLVARGFATTANVIVAPVPTHVRP